MGFNVNINMMCSKAMLFQCSNPHRQSFEECFYGNPDVLELLNVATDEFFEVVRAMEGF